MTSVNPGPDAVTEAARREEDEVDVTERDVASDDIKIDELVRIFHCCAIKPFTSFIANQCLLRQHKLWQNFEIARMLTSKNYVN